MITDQWSAWAQLDDDDDWFVSAPMPAAFARLQSSNRATDIIEEGNDDDDEFLHSKGNWFYLPFWDKFEDRCPFNRIRMRWSVLYIIMRMLNPISGTNCLPHYRAWTIYLSVILNLAFQTHSGFSISGGCYLKQGLKFVMFSMIMEGFIEYFEGMLHTVCIWVSFCRTGKTPVSCPFFLKSRAFVLQNLTQ